MKIKELKFDNNNIFIMSEDETKKITISDVAKHFTEKRFDVLIILKENKPYYIMTTSDIIDVLVNHYENLTLFEYIISNPKHLITIKEDESVFEAYRIMRTHKLHNLIVVNSKNEYLYVINFYNFSYYLTEIALKDDLTDLYNRRFFDFIIDKYQSENIEIGIVFIDINKFKLINDSYGHLFGDKVLKIISKIIKESIRSIDYAFRYGGDEIVLMIFADKDKLKEIALRIKEKINSTTIDNINISVSVGYAHFPNETDSLYEALNIADERMYEDKKRSEKKYKIPTK